MSYNNSTATTGFNLNNFRHLKFMVYSATAKTINLDLETAINVSNVRLAKSYALPAATWTQVTFDFTGNNASATLSNPNGWNSIIRVRVDNGTNGDGSTYYFDEFTMEPATYETVADGDWGTGANWSPANAPKQIGDDIDVKHNMTYTGNLSLKKVLVRNNKSLDITGDLTVAEQSSLWGGSSLKVSGTSTGNWAYFRPIELPGAAGDLEGWHLVSSPVSGEQYNDAWISAFNIASSTTVATRRGIGTYNQTTAEGSFTYVVDGVADTDFTEGKGYIMKTDGTQVVQFIGGIRTTNITDIALTVDGTNGYNLLGNPFSSYVSLSDLMMANDDGGNDLLTESTIWIWNATSKMYEPKTGAYQIAPGQGFFVEATAAASTFTVNTSMLSAQTTDTFQKSANTEIQLNISDGDLTRYAKVNYSSDATTEFDNGKDAKLFGGIAQPFAVYTNLLTNNNGKKYQIQAIPNSDYESMVVPVGVNAEAGKEITFTAEALNLPDGINVILEDREANTFTILDEEDASYKVTLTEAIDGVGRFYLHTTEQQALSTANFNVDNISVYKSNASTLKIVGLQQGNATISLYNILGKQVLRNSFTTNGVQNINLPKLAKGVYVVKIESAAGKLNKKIILE
ncbi:T9SS type A sorting domain-containing protein [Polaribacter sp. Q13]|uniref:T9SS type A sorting domain-containing protein n=1 Tax=Polaribacter sp. Q13 TaxID=2806551 RepID=UPI00193C3810|nr:T9SS type A sorting domain-containing protein [Polaribacter sp. Q13]QVY66145.1 T9SS type A sorting domain-containing protein [Polaribacter sp. Q13]